MQGVLKSIRREKIFLLATVAGAALFSAFAVFGGLTGSDVVKLNPTSLSIDSSGAWVEDSAAWSLSDRDTSTAYAPYNERHEHPRHPTAGDRSFGPQGLR